MTLEKQDPEVYDTIVHELSRQQNTLVMIPSENYVSESVLQATGSIHTNKYSEGYPKRRYYQGNKYADDVELIAIERAKKLFGADHVNVQPYSGSPANQAVFLAFLEPGDTFIGFDLPSGGHLTHGSPVNFSGKIYNAINYGVDKETHLLDMEHIRQLALEHKPKMIISGFTAYPRRVDFDAFSKIAQEVGAIHLADISHIAGLIAGGAHANPFPHADIVTSTTHKTLRGPRGAIIMCKEEYAKKIDKAVFPGNQGGPHNHTTAAMAVTFKEDLQPEFKDYAQQIVRNAAVLATSLKDGGITLVTGGTDNHLILINLLSMGVGLGKPAAVALENAGIITNCNTVPYDPSSPFRPSGVRIGTPALTTRGMKEPEMKQIGKWMAMIIKDMENEELQEKIRSEVEALCKKFPVYQNL